MNAFLSALLLQSGYNTAVVTVGAALLGASAGAIGTFVLLRKRALVSDAVSHATLPGLAAAFMIMVMIDGDGRWLPGLMIGAALSAAAGLRLVEWLTRRTRLAEDAAIGIVLSVFFGLGVVLLTVIQTLDTGRQAGISGYLVGATAGMLAGEARVIAVAAVLVGAAVFVLRRPFTLVCFDQDYAAVRGIDVRATDLAMMALLLAVTVIGLKIAGLVMIVALTITPAVTARLWTDRPGTMALIAAAIGALAAWVGAAISTLDQGLPTGAVIVLSSAVLFAISLLAAPGHGLVSRAARQRRFKTVVLERQGLLAIARGLPPAGDTLAALKRRGWWSGSAPTPAGKAAAVEAARDEDRWRAYRALHPEEAAASPSQGILPLTLELSAEMIATLDRQGAAA